MYKLSYNLANCMCEDSKQESESDYILNRVFRHLEMLESVFYCMVVYAVL